MSNGDDPEADAEEQAADAEEQEGAGEPSFEERLDAARDALAGEDPEEAVGTALEECRAALDLAETESDLDALEDVAGEIETALGDADLPEPEDEDEEGPREALESELSDLRDEIEEARGPYAEDVIEAVESAQGTIADTRWTERGESEVIEAVTAFVDATNEALESALDAPDAIDEAGDALEAVVDAVDAGGLDPDEDAGTIATLIEATDALESGVENAEEWDDLSVREQMRAQGFYDVLDHRKDFPPEWHALKVWEKRGNAEMVLLALENFESDFMERHCLEALHRMGAEEAIDPMLQRANRRDQDAIEILGKIGSEEPVETLLEYAGEDADDALRRVTLKALGEIGSEEATQVAANGLAAENPSVRSRAARALGLIGDTRAIEPLADALEADGDEDVRASAAWALVQIGTRDALEVAAEYADDRSFLVQSEAETAADALGAVEA